MKGRFKLNMQIVPVKETNSLSDLIGTTSYILPKEFELLPNTLESFELESEFATNEHKFFTKDKIIRRVTFFKSVDGIHTYHYLICLNNSTLTLKRKSEITKLYFKKSNFSTAYAIHKLFPFQGKFHTQLIKGIFNTLKTCLFERGKNAYTS